LLHACLNNFSQEHREFSGSFENRIRAYFSLKRRFRAGWIGFKSFIDALPKPRYIERIECRISAYHRDLFGNRLRNNHPVEGVFVVHRQRGQDRGVWQSYGEYDKAASVNPCGPELFKWKSQRLLAKADLDGNLPITRRTNQNFVSRVGDK
jgi:hypothetical protein